MLCSWSWAKVEGSQHKRCFPLGSIKCHSIIREIQSSLFTGWDGRVIDKKGNRQTPIFVFISDLAWQPSSSQTWKSIFPAQAVRAPLSEGSVFLIVSLPRWLSGSVPPEQSTISLQLSHYRSIAASYFPPRSIYCCCVKIPPFVVLSSLQVEGIVRWIIILFCAVCEDGVVNLL